MALPCLGMHNRRNRNAALARQQQEDKRTREEAQNRANLEHALALSRLEQEKHETSEEEALSIALQASLASYQAEQSSSSSDDDLAFELETIATLEAIERAQAEKESAVSNAPDNVQLDPEVLAALAGIKANLQHEQEKADAALARTLQAELNGATSSPPAPAQATKPAAPAKKQVVPRGKGKGRAVTAPAKHSAHARIVPAKNLERITAIKQQGATCGHHAIFNARAIQNLIDQNKPIIAANIQQETRQYLPRIKDHNDREISELLTEHAQDLNLHNLNLYFIECDDQAGFIPAGIGFNTPEDHNTFLQTIWLENKIGHFICNTGGHWVTLTVLKLAGDVEPRVIFMDSANPKVISQKIHKTAQALLSKKPSL